MDEEQPRYFAATPQWYIVPPPNPFPFAPSVPTTSRNADEPLVTRAVADYLADWFSKEPA
jgi:hypothetical protein